jgi:hypothetical protein
MSFSENFLRWQIIDEWKHDKIYQKDDITIWNEVLYIALTQSQIVTPRIFPFNSTDWISLSGKSIFWSYSVNGTSELTLRNNVLELGKKIFDSNVVVPPLVYNSGEYYYSSGVPGINFWSPNSAYSIDEVVLQQGVLWKSTVDNNLKRPIAKEYYIENGVYKQYWEITKDYTSIWKEVEIWNPQKDYLITNSTWNSQFTRGHYVVHEDIVYVTKSDTLKGIDPSLDNNWKRLYSLTPETNFGYFNDFNENYNPIIRMNNRYYFCKDNDHDLSDTEFEKIVKYFEGYEDYQIENDFEEIVKFFCGIE